MPRIRSWLMAGIEWLRAADLRLVAELVAIALLGWLFFAIGGEVSELDTAEVDRAILLALRAAPDDPIGPRALEVGVMHLSALGSAAVSALVVLVASAFLALAGHRRYALVVLGGAVVTALAMWLLKDLYQRPRPDFVLQIDPPDSLSFPSGHSMIAAALYPMLAVLVARTLERRRLRVFVVATGAFLALVIGVSRVYLGVHYPTDVVAGWTAGLVIALVAGIVIRRVGRRADPSAVAATDQPAPG